MGLPTRLPVQTLDYRIGESSSPEFAAEIEDYCVKRNMLYFRSSVQTPFDELVLRVFRAGGFLK